MYGHLEEQRGGEEEGGFKAHKKGGDWVVQFLWDAVDHSRHHA